MLRRVPTPNVDFNVNIGTPPNPAPRPAEDAGLRESSVQERAQGRTGSGRGR